MSVEKGMADPLAGQSGQYGKATVWETSPSPWIDLSSRAVITSAGTLR